MKLNTETLYQRLTNEEDARACKDINDEACQEVPGNFILILLSQIFSKLGDAFLNPKITLPWLMNSLQVPVGFVAWLVPIRESGSLLPQLFIASVIRKKPIRKTVYVIGALGQAACVLLMGLAALRFQGSSAGFAIIGLLVVFSLMRGLCSVASKDVLGKTIPKSKRGQLSGWAASFVGLLTLVMAVTLYFWDSVKPKSDFEGTLIAAALIIASLFWFLSAVTYGKVTEFKGETSGGKNGWLHGVKRLKLVISEPQFGQFVLARAFLLCSALSAPYYILVAQNNQSANYASLALFLFVSGLAGFVSGPIWGRLSDLSSRMVMVLGGSVSALTGLMVWAFVYFEVSLLASIWLIPACYFLLSLAHQGVRLGRKTYLVDMATGDKRTDYVAVSNTLIGLILLGLGLLGTLSQFLSPANLILVLSCMGFLGALMSLSLKEVSEEGD